MNVGPPHGRMEVAQNSERWDDAGELPCRLTVEMAVPGFNVAQLLALEVGTVVDTGRPVGIEVPVQVNGELIGWGEFEDSGGRLAIRTTGIA